MTAAIALIASTAGLGEIGARVLDVVLVALAIAIAYRFPRAVPYMAVFSVGLQSTLTHWLTSDGDVLVGLVVGLAIARFTTPRTAQHGTTSYTVLALLGLALVVLLSFLANANGPYGQQVGLASEYFLSRVALVIALTLLSDKNSESQVRWARAIGLLALALSIYRIGQVVGLPLKVVADALHIAVLGDYFDRPDANTFGVLAAIGIPFLLLGVGQDGRQQLHLNLVRWLAAAAVMVALTSTESRTAAVIVAIALAVLVVVAKSRWRRMSIVGLAMVYVVGSLVPAFSIAQKPIVVPTQDIASSTVATDEVPLGAPPQTPPAGKTPSPGVQPTPPTTDHPALPALVPEWRSVLDRDTYRLESTLPPVDRSRRDHYLVFVARAPTSSADITLRISVNGTGVADLRPSQMSSHYHWQEVHVPDALANTGRPVVVEFAAAGSLDSASNYFLIGGVNARSAGYESRIWTGHAWLADDLSSDPGVQVGLPIVFMDGRVPSLAYFGVPPASVIDPSIRDRFVLWDAAVLGFLHHPLLGSGFYSFGLWLDRYKPQDSPLFFHYANAHSNYFQLLSDLGLAGPILFTLVFAIPLWVNIRRMIVGWRGNDWLAPAFAVALVAMLASSLTQTWLADSRIYILALLLALISTGSDQGVPSIRALRATLIKFRANSYKSPP